jgi:hypothetical protein
MEVPGTDLEVSDLMVSEYIRHTEIAGLVVILDLKAGRYFLLEEVAARMWDGIFCHRDRTAIIMGIANEFAVAHTRVEEDFDNFVQSCMAKGFLQVGGVEAVEPKRTQRAGRAAKRFLTLRAWWSLAKTWTLLKLFGFKKLHDVGQSEATIAREPQMLSGSELLRRAEAAFLLAENFFILKTAPRDCLPRSTALFLFLRRLGLPARHHIGVERYPMSMHAWVECNGRLVLDDPDAARMSVVETTGA